MPATPHETSCPYISVTLTPYQVRGFAIPSEGEPEAAAEAEVVNGEDIMKDEELLVLGNVQQMPNKVAERLAEGVEGEPSEQGALRGGGRAFRARCI